MSRILFLGAMSALSVHLMTEATDEAGSPSNGTRIRPNMDNYQTAKSASGSSTKICGDAVSLALVGATLPEAYTFVSKVVGISEDDLRAKYGDKNPGQQRMFLGNLIRGASASKDAEKKARVEAAFQAELTGFRTGIDARLKEASDAKAAEKQAKLDAKAKEKADKDQVKADAAAKRKADAETKAAEKAKAKTAEVKPGADAKPAGRTSTTTQVKGPGSPAQPQ